MPELTDIAELISEAVDPHAYEDVELAIIKGHFCVAENGAVWLTDDINGTTHHSLYLPAPCSDC